jgi:hypothetical protein
MEPMSQVLADERYSSWFDVRGGSEDTHSPVQIVNVKSAVRTM